MPAATTELLSYKIVRFAAFTCKKSFERLAKTRKNENEAFFDWRIENSHSSHGRRKPTCLCVSVLKRRDPMIGRFVIIQWRVWCHEAGFAPTLDWKQKSDDGRRPFVTKAWSRHQLSFDTTLFAKTPFYTP